MADLSEPLHSLWINFLQDCFCQHRVSNLDRMGQVGGRELQWQPDLGGDDTVHTRDSNCSLG